MFVWKTDTIIKQAEIFLPDHVKYLSRAVEEDREPGMEKALKKAFEHLPVISIDFGVMEKAQNVCCVRSTFSWNDVGGWLSLKDFLDKDRDDNYHRGEIVVSESRDNLIFCEDPQETVMLIGIHDLVIVRSGQRTLVTHKNLTEEIKNLVNTYLKKEKS